MIDLTAEIEETFDCLGHSPDGMSDTEAIDTLLEAWATLGSDGPARAAQAALWRRARLRLQLEQQEQTEVN